MKAWILAARLKTLPLATSGILLGSAIAYLHHTFNFTLLLLGILTAVLLQILSNFANDYGDFSKGTDQAAGRSDRALASGAISKLKMKTAIILFTLAALSSGLGLLIVAIHTFSIEFTLMLLFGIGSIVAAITYTIGFKAYGYSGLGDAFVFAFFGIISIAGITYLNLGYIPIITWPAAAGLGLLATAVLNVNNIRDIAGDKMSGKNTIPVRIGYHKAMRYHKLLLWLGLVCVIGSFLWHVYLSVNTVFWMEYFLIIAFFSPAILAVRAHQHRLESVEKTNRDAFNVELKWLSLTVLLTVIMYWIITFFFMA